MQNTLELNARSYIFRKYYLFITALVFHSYFNNGGFAFKLFSIFKHNPTLHGGVHSTPPRFLSSSPSGAILFGPLPVPYASLTRPLPVLYPSLTCLASLGLSRSHKGTGTDTIFDFRNHPPTHPVNL